MANLVAPSAIAAPLPRPIDPPTQNQTAAKTHHFLTSLEGGLTLFSILAGVAIAIAWSVPLGLLGAGVGIVISAAIFYCRSSTPAPIVATNGQSANSADAAGVDSESPSPKPVQAPPEATEPRPAPPAPRVVKTFSHDDNIATYLGTMKYAKDNFPASCLFVEEHSKVIQPEGKDFVAPDHAGVMHKKNIRVMNASTMRTAQALVANGLNPLVLDMACRYNAGGGVKYGSNSQEEIIIRESSLMYGLEAIEQKGGYPMPECGGIFVPQVIFFRADPNEDYAYLETPFAADVYAMAAYNCKPGRDRPANDDDYIAGTTAKITTYLRFAKANGNDSLVAGAFGCGDFENDAKFIAELFRDILETKEFAGYFKEVVFAIINNHNGGNNFEKFQSVLEA